MEENFKKSHKDNVKRKGKGKLGKSPKQLMYYFFNEMEKHKDAQSLNDNILVPFMCALEEVATARDYVLNIYGEKSNIVFSDVEDAKQIFQLVENYFDNKPTRSSD